jgi:hypothetical protein
MKSKKFYVYVHRYASGPKQGDVFYVGKGSNRRALVANRHSNPHWQNVVNKYGFVSEIVIRFQSEACAFSFERAFIKQYGRENLCNLTDGGEGISGSDCKKGKRHHMYDSKEYSFCHLDHGVFTGTRFDFYTTFGLDKGNVDALLKGKAKSCLGWQAGSELKEFNKYENHGAKVSIGRISGRSKLKTHTFISPVGDIVEMNVPEFSEMIGAHKNGVYMVISGKSKTCRGWRYIKQADTPNTHSWVDG